MHTVLGGQEDHSATYIDGILVYSRTEYLGHIVGNGQVAVPEARVRSIQNFKRPVSKKDLSAFLWTTSYYRRFITK